MTETPKVRRNLGPNRKGFSSEVHERVLRTWKELALAIHCEILSRIPEDSLKMCRVCFNDYDKLAIKRAHVEKKLQEALSKLTLAPNSIEQSEVIRTEATNSNTQLLTPNRKRLLEDSHLVGTQMQVVRQASAITSHEAMITSPSAIVS